MYIEFESVAGTACCRGVRGEACEAFVLALLGAGDDGASVGGAGLFKISERRPGVGAMRGDTEIDVIDAVCTRYARSGCMDGREKTFCSRIS